jgi:hypothetical protein
MSHSPPPYGALNGKMIYSNPDLRAGERGTPGVAWKSGDVACTAAGHLVYRLIERCDPECEDVRGWKGSTWWNCEVIMDTGNFSQGEPARRKLVPRMLKVEESLMCAIDIVQLGIVYLQIQEVARALVK